MAEAPKFKIKKRERRTCEIDLSPWVEFPSPCIVTFTEPDVTRTYEARHNVPFFRGRNAEWKDEQCIEVAILSVSHTGPAVIDAPGQFYEALANDNQEGYYAARDGFNAAFPKVDNLTVATAESKND